MPDSDMAVDEGRWGGGDGCERRSEGWLAAASRHPAHAQPPAASDAMGSTGAGAEKRNMTISLNRASSVVSRTYETVVEASGNHRRRDEPAAPSSSLSLPSLPSLLDCGRALRWPSP
jgi:hypothetical protein